MNVCPDMGWGWILILRGHKFLYVLFAVGRFKRSTAEIVFPGLRLCFLNVYYFIILVKAAETRNSCFWSVNWIFFIVSQGLNESEEQPEETFDIRSEKFCLSPWQPLQ